MSAFASLSLLNNAAVAVPFAPAAIDSQGVATWRSSNSVYDAKLRVTMSVSYPKNGSEVVRVRQRVTIPIMDTVDTTKKLGEAYASVEFVLPKRATQTQRLDLRAHVKDLVANAVTTAAVDSFESIY